MSYSNWNKDISTHSRINPSISWFFYTLMIGMVILLIVVMTSMAYHLVYGSTAHIDIVGDVKTGKGYGQLLKDNNADRNIITGDLGYSSNLDSFSKEFLTLKNAKCIIGNHDSNEDGSGAIIKQALEKCKNNWYIRIGNGTSLFIAVNTNGKNSQNYDYAKSKLTDKTLMAPVKNVILLSHKGCNYPTGSHHVVEASVVALCDGIKKLLPTGVSWYEISGHNHFMAEGHNGHWLVTGAGGKSHYEGQLGGEWTFFNNKDYGFLQLEINNGNGVMVGHYYTYSGKLIH